jgi:uncharacterized protein (TIGR00251 family)
MDFFEVKSNNVYLLRVKVKTNSSKQEIMPYSKTDSWLSVKLKSKPVKNKANKELISLIKNRINISSDQIQIISGLKRTNKILEIKLTEKIGRKNLIEKLVG